MTFLILLLPICLVSCLVLAACHEDDMWTIVTRGAKNFALLIGGIAAGSVVVWGVEALL